MSLSDERPYRSTVAIKHHGRPTAPQLLLHTQRSSVWWVLLWAAGCPCRGMGLHANMSARCAEKCKAPGEGRAHWWPVEELAKFGQRGWQCCSCVIFAIFGTRGRRGPLVCRHCSSFVPCVWVPLCFLLYRERRKCSGWNRCIPSWRLPSWWYSSRRRMPRNATASPLFVLWRCDCSGCSCCIQACRESELMLCDIHTRTFVSFLFSEACIIIFCRVSLYPSPSFHPSLHPQPYTSF